MGAVLPDEVVYLIFSYLDSKSLSRALQCSTTFYRIATSSALWEPPYLVRWSTGDEQRERERGTNEWRRHRKLQRLTQHARRAAAELGLATTGTSASPFRYLQLDKQIDLSQSPHLKLDFYRLFLERIRIDQEVLETLYDQVETTHNRIPAVTSLAQRFGSDAKDVLTAVIGAQQSRPSWSPNGLPGKRHSVNHDLAYDTTQGYRLTAYQAHLPTTLRSDTHHLVILYHAREILEHLQRREAMQQMSKLSQAMRDPAAAASLSEPSDSPCISLANQTETGISLLSMFRGGEVTYIEEQLDILAAACDLYLQQHLPQAIKPAETGSFDIDAAKGMALAICDFMADHGFRGARDDWFRDIDNNFLHQCFTTNRETLPLTLAIIFCGIANRLGLAASLCNFPMRIVAVVMADPTAPLPAPTDQLSSAPEGMFWVEVSDHTTKACAALAPTPTDPFARRSPWPQERHPIVDHAKMARYFSSMRLTPVADYWRPAQPVDIMQRAANNILQSVQHSQTNHRDAATTEARTARQEAEFNRSRDILQAQWSSSTRADHAFISSYHGRMDPTEEQAIINQVAAAFDAPTNADATCIDEDETLWSVVEKWRVESLFDLIGTSYREWTTPAHPQGYYYQLHVSRCSTSNDWSYRAANLAARVDQWQEHDEQLAKYAAVNVFLRLGNNFLANEGELIAGFVQNDFPLDVEVMERDLLGVVHAGTTGSANMDDDEASEGSDSSTEASFSAREAAGERAPATENGTGIMLSPGARATVSRMLEAVRVLDRKAPHIQQRVGAKARGKRKQGIPLGNASVTEAEEDGAIDPVAYRVGTIFRHRKYRYLGSIFSWDPHCAASEDWMIYMGVDRLPPPSNRVPHGTTSSPSEPRRGGRHQPFYKSLVDGTSRYVAEVNVERISEPMWIYGVPPNEPGRSLAEIVRSKELKELKMHLFLTMQHRVLGSFFRCFDQRRGRWRRNAKTREIFPDDWSDDDEEDGEEEDLADVEKSSNEILSEDGDW